MVEHNGSSNSHIEGTCPSSILRNVDKEITYIHLFCGQSSSLQDSNSTLLHSALLNSPKMPETDSGRLGHYKGCFLFTSFPRRNAVLQVKGWDCTPVAPSVISTPQIATCLACKEVSLHKLNKNLKTCALSQYQFSQYCWSTRMWKIRTLTITNDSWTQSDYITTAKCMMSWTSPAMYVLKNVQGFPSPPYLQVFNSLRKSLEVAELHVQCGTMAAKGIKILPPHQD